MKLASFKCALNPSVVENEVKLMYTLKGIGSVATFITAYDESQ